MADVPRILAAADSAVIVEFDGPVDEAGQRALALGTALSERPLPGVVAAVLGLRSLLVEYEGTTTARASVVAGIPRRLVVRGRTIQPCSWQIPVCADGDMAPDP